MTNVEIADPQQAASKVLTGLPLPDYASNYQPVYEDEDALMESVRELHVTDPVTTPAQVDAVSLQLARIASGKVARPVLILGGCHESVDADTPISNLVEGSSRTLQIVSASALRHAFTILRNRGQSTKPRTNEQEKLPDGTVVVSHMGDAVNGRAVTDRRPDPRRMVEAALQARDLERGLTVETGRHIPAAHEALLLPYEQSFVRKDSATGTNYLLSADLPWIGVRTNSPDSEHIDLLAGVKNSVGVKVGADSDPGHLHELIERLNPDAQPGKLVLMFRLGLDNLHLLPPLLRTVKDRAPGTILMSDIHGSTRTRPADGKKIRLVSDIIKETQAVACLCQAEGLRLHGLHLETTTVDDRLECIDDISQDPQQGNVDPQLNPAQTRRVLDTVAPYLALRPVSRS